MQEKGNARNKDSRSARLKIELEGILQYPGLTTPQNAAEGHLYKMKEVKGVGKVTRQREFKELRLEENEDQDRFGGSLAISMSDGPTV